MNSPISAAIDPLIHASLIEVPRHFESSRGDSVTATSVYQ